MTALVMVCMACVAAMIKLSHITWALVWASSNVPTYRPAPSRTLLTLSFLA